MDHLPDTIEWPQRTRDWWQAWADSPVSATWTPLHWEYLLDTALLHATVWGTGDVTKAGELRARCERLGQLNPATTGPQQIIETGGPVHVGPYPPA